MNRDIIEKKVEEIQDELIKKIKELISIYSVESTPKENAPFGQGPKDALDYVLNLSKSLGFETKNLDNKVGYAQFGDNKNDKYIGIFGHVDVVAIGKGWKKDPLIASISDNKLYGRGSLDNKGPILSNLFALYTLKILGFKPKIPIRIIFGTNEESGFKCIKHYLSKENPPLFGWTPDCKWPVVYGERGRVRFRISSNNKDLHLFYNFLNEYIFSSTNDGKKLGIDYYDEDFGKTIIRNFELKENNGYSYFDFSVTHPAICNMEKLKLDIQSKLYKNLKLEVINYWNCVLYDKDSVFVKCLQKVYNDITKLEAKPVTTTGGTYAKLVPNIIAFGPSFPGQKDIAHLPDEWIDLDDLKINTKIYAISIYELDKLIKGEK